ncbi:MAG: Bifunctional (p)ppGpp synthase/hydrolase SpoT [candidate division WS2 bacterium ADurb.Bin280]|uniref:Bifunctional (P)ppGpp synthase/hydrolase SpoT n=1 Tax=candidate division WS2 bacterium ADurb.Bin280 TaxID=1852829 RepID=A0A1V5SFG0_9BACT|nr:MAG: Bifunctional (p)ppGpp synthase/hydrolase SpoT [candidate division WS2 bacterium ADurb.Bin280]
MENYSIEKLKKTLLDGAGTYLSTQEVKKISKAISIALDAHKGQKRNSGDDFIVHPLSVAIILLELKVDADTLIAAVLHDTIEDTEYKINEIKKVFNADVAKLVESVTKLSNVRIKKTWFPFWKVKKEEIPEFERQMETLRKMLVAMSKDIRVIIIKLADKIHNLRTLKYLDKEKRERIASETIEIFAPIAGRLGIGKWKGNLEDLAFVHLYPHEYEKLREMAIPKIKDREKILAKLSKEVEQMLADGSIEAQVDYRAKRWYSLYKKLEKYDGDLDKIHDLIAIRVIVKNLEDCYGALGIIHGKWKPLIGRIKDYIALPKPNGYQSLHTTVFTNAGEIVEIQIRTESMHEQAEFGIASHWIYSQDRRSKKPNRKEVDWLKEFSKFQKSITNPAEFFKVLKMDLFENRIFVFTPDGDVKDLPSGATAIDFAYSVHTQVGNHCFGAKVNNKITSFDKPLSNGDIVEIITAKKTTPNKDWLNFCKTQAARNNIRKFTR